MKTAQDFIDAAAGSYELVGAERATAMLAAGALLLDVREAYEFAENHLPDAVNIPRGILEFAAAQHPELAGAHARPIVICCKTCGRSILAAQRLKEMGYANVYVLEGGVDNFCQQ